MSPLPAANALDTFFLEARVKILDLAAILDRIGRGKDASVVASDPRLEKIRKALDILLDPSVGRAERVQHIFSLEYEPKWERPRPLLEQQSARTANCR